jgi:GLPGLI family protein
MYTTASAQITKQFEKLRYSLTYKLTMQIDTTPASKRTELTVLRVGDSVHHFLGYAYHQMDSVLNASSGLNAIDALAETEIFFKNEPLINYKIYKNIAKSIYKHMETSFFTRYSYYDSLSIAWRIESKKDTINGYLCQRATTLFAGRSYEAWFTLDVPLRAAPYKFDGLPGLVVKVSDKQKHYTFELVSLYRGTGKEYLYKEDVGARQVTREAFLQQHYNVANKTYMQLMIEDEGTEFTELTPEDERAYGRKAKPFIPNYIELE